MLYCFLALILLTVTAVFALALFVSIIPALLIGLAIEKLLLPRFGMIVEFLYPSALGKWFHLGLLRLSSPKNNDDSCSFTFSEIGDDLLVFVIPAFTDNMMYVVLRPSQMVAVVVDVGDCKALLHGLEEISATKYDGRAITVEACLRCAPTGGGIHAWNCFLFFCSFLVRDTSNTNHVVCAAPTSTTITRPETGA